MRRFTIVRTFLLALSVAIVSCFYIGKDEYEDILQKLPEEWSSRDCLTVLLSVMQHNLFDDATNVTVIATPYYPSVVTAIGRMQQLSQHLTESEFHSQLDSSLVLQSGVFMDWTKRAIVDRRGNYVRDATQFDSLMFLITLKNRTWPCAVPLQQVRMEGGAIVMRPLLSLADWPCYLPDLTGLEHNISMTNDMGDTLRPCYVWGKRRTQLTMDETLIAMFSLGVIRDGHRFLSGSSGVRLLIGGFDKNLALRFPLARFR